MLIGISICLLILLTTLMLSRFRLSIRIAFGHGRQRGIVRLLWGERHLPIRIKRAPFSLLRLCRLLAHPRLWGGLVTAFWNLVSAYIRASQITRLEGTLVWGTGVPAATTLLVTPLSWLAAFIMMRDERVHLTLVPDFQSATLQFRGRLIVTLPLWKILWPTLRFLGHRSVRRARRLFQS